MAESVLQKKLVLGELLELLEKAFYRILELGVPDTGRA